MSSDYPRENIRNIVLVAPHGAGKTSLAEGLLYLNGSLDKLGKVDNGSTYLDAEAEEKSRQMTINTQVGYYDHKGYNVNIIDTPGFPNFLYQAELAVDVTDTAILIVSGVADSKEQIDRFWEIISSRNVSSLIFMNKLDKERADFETSLSQLKETLKINPVVLSVPIGLEKDFKGVVDLLSMKAYMLDGTKTNIQDIPEEVVELSNTYREKLIDSIAENDDELLERYLNGEEISDEELQNTLRKAVVSRDAIPLVVGSAIELTGLDYLTQIINNILPSPLDRKNIEAKKGEEAQDIKPLVDGPVVASVFKTISDPYAGKISIMRIFSGSVNSDATLLNSADESKIKIGQISKILGKKLNHVDKAECGDIVAINKIKDLHTTQTLTSDSVPMAVTLTNPPHAVLSYAIEPKSRGDEDKLMPSLSKIAEEDPTLDYHRDEQTNDFLLSGTGQMHVEIVVERLKNVYGVTVDLKTPKIPYKETIKKSSKAEGKYIKQTGGRGQYGDAWIQIDPLTNGQDFEFVDKIVGGVIPKNFIPSVEKGVKDAMKKGVYAGYPVVGVRVTVFDGKYHPVDSSDVAFQIAGSMGFKKAMEEAKPTLLEPIMKMKIFTPEEVMGDVIGDINSRRGKVSGMDTAAGGSEINANVPMAEILTYAPELRSITSGRGNFTVEFSHYEEVPAQISQKIVEAQKSAESAEE
ncbi:MAG: elongation factor G [Candidatus Dadabacteria bacterium]|nr:elongation factor G [Candidatus Dadabacteria bacterium]NIS09419.1 elongation factor G [Candidatus Dadabacteria bacterium]NIV42570.1 elongation factor G [Candidatus Dadabacteria bacterium]NIY22657.1 elongation factor G [Candidatus Dadabacteria bacterium]